MTRVRLPAKLFRILGLSCAALAMPLGALATYLINDQSSNSVLRLTVLGALIVCVLIPVFSLMTWISERRERKHIKDPRLLVHPARVKEIDPTNVGIKEPTQPTLAARYLPRNSADAQLDSYIAGALARNAERWMVVVAGDARVGKSRTLFDALRRYDIGRRSASPMPSGIRARLIYRWLSIEKRVALQQNRLQLVAPRNADDLKSLLDTALPPLDVESPAVLWLDAVEPFIDNGVTRNDLREWKSQAPNRIVAATLGGIECLNISEIDRLRGVMRTVALGITGENELQLRHAKLSKNKNQWASACRYGWAAFLTAGWGLEEALENSKHQGDAIPCPEGHAVVQSVIDWARCRRTDPISAGVLRQLWPAYLPTGVAPTDDRFKLGLEWALRPIAGTFALIEEVDTGSYRVDGYTVQVDRKFRSEPPSAEALAAARGSPFTGGDDSAISGWDIQIDHYHSNHDAALRKSAMKALYNKAAALMAQGTRAYSTGRSDRPQRQLDATLAVQGLIDECSRGPVDDIDVRRLKSWALLKKSELYHRAGRYDECLSTLALLAKTFSEDTDAEISANLRKAIIERGHIFNSRHVRSDEGTAATRALLRLCRAELAAITRGSDYEIARALLNKAAMLRYLDSSPGECQQALVQLIEDYGETEDPTIRRLVAKGLATLGNHYEAFGNSELARTQFLRVINQFSGSPDLEVQEMVGHARKGLDRLTG